MEPVIKVKGLTKKFGTFTAVENVDMSIPENVVYGFLGPNGSGKTTAIRMMCGLLNPTAGDITVMGMKVPQQAEDVRRMVGYMTQKFSLYGDLTAQQNLKFIGKIMGIYGKDLTYRIAELMELFSLYPFKENLAGTLSGGQKRRLALAAAVIHKPKLLLLDEPTSEVDPNTRRDFWDALFEMCEQGATILVTTHLMDEAERCNHLAIIDEGKKVADGTPEQLKSELACNMLEIKGAHLQKIRDELAMQKAVISTTQVGITLRVMVAKDLGNPARWLGEVLPNSRKMTVTEVPPSIEDVFVMATSENQIAKGDL